MGPKMRQRVNELEKIYRQYDPAMAVNRLCVVVARLEIELAGTREERDEFAKQIGMGPGGQPVGEIT